MASLVFERFGLDASKIIDTLKGECKDIEWEKSNVYKVSTQEKVLDEAVRRSHFRSITKCENLFNFCEELLLGSFANEMYDFSIVRNDAMHIKYQVGDFFKEHSDFLSLNSNIIEEFTFIICVLPTSYEEKVIGGETKVKLNADSVTLSKATTTPGGALLFRKDLFHEGLPLESGQKEILMVNVWGVRRSTDEYLVVTFPKDQFHGSQGLSQAARETEEGESNKTIFEREMNSKFYVIPIINFKDFPECFFSGFIEFYKRNNPVASSRLVTYTCNVCNYEQFRVVFEVLTRQRLSGSVMSEVELELLDFFSIPRKAGLLEVAKKLGEAEAAPSTLSEKRTVVIEKDFVIFDSDERTKVFSDMANKLKVPYAPFSIVYCEGETKTRGDIGWEDAKMKMIPVLFTVGDYGNIFGVRHIPLASDEDLTAKFEDHMPLSDAKIPEVVNICRICDEDGDETLAENAKANEPYVIALNYFSEYSNVCGLGLRLANNKLPLGKFLRKVCGTCGGHPGQYLEDIDLEYLPGRTDRFQPLSKYCHRDSKNQICFDEQEAKETFTHLAKVNFVERIRAHLVDQNIHLHFPQTQNNSSIFYCNEVRYIYY
jgi:hypothetical protein